MKRLALIFFLGCLAASSAWCAPNPVEGLFKQAQAATRERKFDDALHFYECVMVEHPEAVGMSWYRAQKGIADVLARKGDLPEAAKAARLCLDGAPSLAAFGEAITFTANILSALDKNVDRANQFLAFEQAGPGGGLVNPIETIEYPLLPGRERAFAIMRQEAGDTPAASEFRAFTYLFTGKRTEALAQFADAFRRSSQNSDLQRTAPDLAIVGLRAIHGTSVGLEAAIQFIVFGPDGPDGIQNTADDIADPFAKWIPPAPPVGEGGMAGLSAEDITALRKVRDAAKLYVQDPWVNGRIRYNFRRALQRSNDALDNWGEAGQKEWYLQLAFTKGAVNVDDGLLEGAQAAARCRSLHFGAVYGVRKQIDAYCVAQGIKPTDGMVRSSGADFKALCAALQQIRFEEGNLKPLKSPASFQ